MIYQKLKQLNTISRVGIFMGYGACQRAVTIYSEMDGLRGVTLLL